jgi:hypothetical protein
VDDLILRTHFAIRVGLFLNNIYLVGYLVAFVLHGLYVASPSALKAARANYVLKLSFIINVLAMLYNGAKMDLWVPQGAYMMGLWGSASIVGAYLWHRRAWPVLHAPGLFVSIVPVAVTLFGLVGAGTGDAFGYNPERLALEAAQLGLADIVARYAAVLGFGHAVVAGSLALAATTFGTPMSARLAGRLGFNPADPRPVVYRTVHAASRAFPFLLLAVFAETGARLAAARPPDVLNPESWLVATLACLVGAATALRTAENLPRLVLALSSAVVPFATLWPLGAPGATGLVAPLHGNDTLLVGQMAGAVYLAAFIVSSTRFFRNPPWRRRAHTDQDAITLKELTESPEAVGLDVEGGAARMVAALRSLGYRQDDRMLARIGQHIDEAAGFAARGVPGFVFVFIFVAGLPVVLGMSLLFARSWPAETVLNLTTGATASLAPVASGERLVATAVSVTPKSYMAVVPTWTGGGLLAWMFGVSGYDERRGEYLQARALPVATVNATLYDTDRELARLHLTEGRAVEAAKLSFALRSGTSPASGQPSEVTVGVIPSQPTGTLLIAAVVVLVGAFGRYYGRAHRVRWAYKGGQLFFEIRAAGPWIDRRKLAEYIITAVADAPAPKGPAVDQAAQA